LKSLWENLSQDCSSNLLSQNTCEINPFLYKYFLYTQVQVDHKKEPKPIAFSNLFKQDIYPKRKRFTTPHTFGISQNVFEQLKPDCGPSWQSFKITPESGSWPQFDSSRSVLIPSDSIQCDSIRFDPNTFWGTNEVTRPSLIQMHFGRGRRALNSP